MISTSKKFIFVRIPRTGSHSVRVALKEHWDNYADAPHIALTSHNLDDLEGYYRFGCVRNPYERVISAVFHNKKKWDSAFAKNIPSLVIAGRFAIGIHSKYAPQTWFLDGKMDYIMRFENLEEDFKAVCKGIGLPETPLPHLNFSKKTKHYSHYYDDHLRELVEKAYKADLEMFGYTYENLRNN